MRGAGSQVPADSYVGKSQLHHDSFLRLALVPVDAKRAYALRKGGTCGSGGSNERLLLTSLFYVLLLWLGQGAFRSVFGCIIVMMYWIDAH